MVTKKKYPPRVLLAKIGLDGHDRGVKVLARSFRDAGMEVIYTGLWQTCEATMCAALQEDVDVIGVSLLSAAHMTVMPELVRLRRELGIEDMPLVLGGIVPAADQPRLLEMGVAAVFNPGSAMETIVAKLFELAESRDPLPPDRLIAAYARHDTQALARLITLIQRQQDLSAWQVTPGKVIVLGITGSPGVGKSSFIGQLAASLRQRDKRVAVIAVDPTSPVSGGALLGDRLRMMAGKPDNNVFVRSLSSGSRQGGLAPCCQEVVSALAGFGFDVVLVETVGAGQTDVAIHGLAGNVLLMMMPEAGDAIQFSKAGIMEIASGFVINKCDLPGADATAWQLRSAVSDLPPHFSSQYGPAGRHRGRGRLGPGIGSSLRRRESLKRTASDLSRSGQRHIKGP